jgi:hypothetical protein
VEGIETEKAPARPDYLSYLLRLWRVREEGQDVWRASLQHAGTGKRASFRTLEELFGFLRRATGAAQDLDKSGETGSGA